MTYPGSMGTAQNDYRSCPDIAIVMADCHILQIRLYNTARLMRTVDGRRFVDVNITVVKLLVVFINICLSKLIIMDMIVPKLMIGWWL